MALRNTWGNPVVFNELLPEGQHAKLIFILGTPKDKHIQKMVDYEAEVYRDIVQVNFVDHYRNNTYKAIYHMKWVGLAIWSRSFHVSPIRHTVRFGLLWPEHTRGKPVAKQVLRETAQGGG